MHASHCFSWNSQIEHTPNPQNASKALRAIQGLAVNGYKLYVPRDSHSYLKGCIEKVASPHACLPLGHSSSLINIIITISFQSIFKIFSMHFLYGPPGWQHYIKYYFLPLTFPGHIISLTSIPAKIVLRLPRINLCKPCMNLPWWYHQSEWCFSK